MNSTNTRILPVSMPPDDLSQPADNARDPARVEPSGHPPDPAARQIRIQVFEARSDGQGGWRLDDSTGTGSSRGGWAGRVRQCLLLALSIAVAAALWLFAFALMLVLLPLVALAGWYLWRRLRAMQRVQAARGHDSDMP